MAEPLVILPNIKPPKLKKKKEPNKKRKKE